MEENLEQNKEVSDNKVLNGNGNSTNVEIDTTLEGDIVDRAIESVQRKAENIKKILILISPLFLILGGGSLEMFGITNMVGDDEHFKNKLEVLANILIKDEIKRHKSHS